MAEFEIGDLGWAKMKGFPAWPAKILEPSETVKPPKSKEPMYWVQFFGSNNNSWIAESNILPYEEGRLKYEDKNVTGNLKKAVIEMISYEKDHPQKKRILETPKTNGVPVDSLTVNHKLTSSNIKGSQKSSSKRGSKSTINSVKKKRRSSDNSSNLSVDSNTSHADKGDDYSTILTDTTDYTIYSRNFENNYNWDLTSTPVTPTSRLINRAVPEIPVAPVLNVHNKSDVIQNRRITPSTLKIGFLGLGVMGSLMVKNLLHAKHNVTVWNRSPEKCKLLAEIGANIGQTPADVVAASDITFSCLSDPQAAKHIVFCNCGVLESMSRDKGYIDMTSIDPETSHSIFEAITFKGGRYLEVPAIGTREHAYDGNLILLAAGDKDLLHSANSCFETISRNLFFLGDVGKASKMNLIINMVMGTCFSAVAEAMSVAERSEISLQEVLSVLEHRDLNCPAVIQQAKAIVNQSFNVAQMPLQHMQRNLYLALEIGDQFAQPLPTTAAANEVFKHVKRMGYGQHDVSAVFMRGRF